MAKLVTLTVAILASISLTSCSTYTKGLQQSVARADEITALTALRTVAMAQQTYAVSNNGAFGTFTQLAEGGYLESRFKSESPQIKGYVLTMTVKPRSDGMPDFFSCNADPTGTGETAGRHLYIDSASPEIKVNATKPATAEDEAYKP